MTESSAPTTAGSAVPTLSFIGTATTLLRLGPFTVLTDPNFLHRGERAYLGHGLWSKRLTEPAMPPGGLPPLDLVLLSHLHGDHFDRRASRELDKALPIVTTRHAARRLRGRGFQNSVALDTWQAHEVQRDGATLRITSMPGQHAPGAAKGLLPPVMGSLAELTPARGGRPFRLYITGDTLMREELRAIPERYPDLDAAVVHIGGTKILGMLVTMDAQQGVDLVELVRPRVAVPVHYDDYGVFRSPLSDFRREAEQRGPAAAICYVERGQTVPLTQDAS